MRIELVVLLTTVMSCMIEARRLINATKPLLNPEARMLSSTIVPESRKNISMFPITHHNIVVNPKPSGWVRNTSIHTTAIKIAESVQRNPLPTRKGNSRLKVTSSPLMRSRKVTPGPFSIHAESIGKDGYTTPNTMPKTNRTRLPSLQENHEFESMKIKPMRNPVTLPGIHKDPSSFNERNDFFTSSLAPRIKKIRMTALQDKNEIETMTMLPNFMKSKVSTVSPSIYRKRNNLIERNGYITSSTETNVNRISLSAFQDKNGVARVKMVPILMKPVKSSTIARNDHKEKNGDVETDETTTPISRQKIKKLEVIMQENDDQNRESKKITRHFINGHSFGRPQDKLDSYDVENDQSSRFRYKRLSTENLITEINVNLKENEDTDDKEVGEEYLFIKDGRRDPAAKEYKVELEETITTGVPDASYKFKRSVIEEENLGSTVSGVKFAYRDSDVRLNNDLSYKNINK